jgi:hypothetical protein
MRAIRRALRVDVYNSGWGGKIERVLAHVLSRDNSRYRLDAVIVMKTMNITPPADDTDDKSHRVSIAKQPAGETGQPEELVLQAMDGIFTLWQVL